MKRKESPHFSFSSPSAKARRLGLKDGGLLSLAQEEPRVTIKNMDKDPYLTSSTSTRAIQTVVSALQTVDHLEEKAILLHHHSPNTKFPTLPDFPIVLDSNLIPGIRDHILWPEISKTVRLMEDEVIANKNTEVLNDCWAVVPRVASQTSMIPPEQGKSTGFFKPMNAEKVEGEMMDIDDASTSSSPENGFELRGMVEGVEGLQYWQQQQQHCMALQLPNKSTPVTW